jgi:hypothetical protein
MIPTTNDAVVVAVDNDNNNTERRNNGSFFSRFRGRRRDPTATTEKNTTNNNNNNKYHHHHQDETTTFGEITDDEESFSSSFDDIDQLLALPSSSSLDYCTEADPADVVPASSSSSSPLSSSSSPSSTVVTTTPSSQPPTLLQIVANNYTTSSTTTITYDELPSNNSIYKCINYLSSNDIDLNRVGLQKLIMLTKGRTLSGLYNSEEIISYILIYGGPFGSVEERLRYIFATMICNSPHYYANDNDNANANNANNNANANDNANDNDNANANDNDNGNNHYQNQNQNQNNNELYDDDYFDDYDEEKYALFKWISEYNPNNELDNLNLNLNINRSNRNKINNRMVHDDDDDDRNDNSCYSSERKSFSQQHPEGKGNGILHNHALRVLSNALGKVSSSMKYNSISSSSSSSSDDEGIMKQEQEERQIPLDGTIWKNIIRCIVNNIESSNDCTGNARNINGIGYSLKILRLLYEIQSEKMILSLLRHTLFTSLVYLQEYSKVHQFPMIYKESSYLLQRATSKAKQSKVKCMLK